MNNTKTVRKIKKEVKFVIFFFIIVLSGYFFWNVASFVISPKKAVSDATQIQQEYKDNYLKANGQEKIKSLAQAFTADFFSLRDKSRKGDIGGVEFFEPTLVDSFREYVYSSYYSYFDEIKKEDGSGMPNVEDVKIIASRQIGTLPYTSRVNFDPEVAPKNVTAVDVAINYDDKTTNETRYHHNATVYIQKIKGEYKVIKLVSK